MSSQEYYDNTGYPAFGSPGSSAPMRGEFVKIENGFGKLPDLSGHANEVVVINGAATGMTSVGTTGTGNFVRANDPTFALSDLTTNNATVSQHGWMPKLSGSTTQFFRGDGVFAAPPGASLVPSNRSSNTIFASGDTSTIVRYTSGTFTQTFTAAVTLSSGWFIWLQNSGTGDIMLAPNGAELIDGLSSFIMYPGEVRLVQCTGTGFQSAVANGFSKTFTANGTFTKPPGYSYFEGELWGGGASGAKSNNISNGAGGGGGGCCLPFKLAASLFGTTEAVTISTGGAAVSVASNGNVGGNSTLGALLTSYGGGGGAQNAGNANGGGGGGALSAGQTGGSGGQPSAGATANTGWGGGDGNGQGNSALGGAGGAIGVDSVSGPQPPGSSVWGGAGGGGTGNAIGNGGISLFGGNGGAGNSASSGVAGTAPGGGGGGTHTGANSGAGARGELRIRGVA